MKPFSSSNKDPTLIDKKIISLTLLNFTPQIHMQPTFPPLLHIKFQSSTDTTLDQAPEPFPNIALIMSLLKNLYFVYLLLIFFLNYFLF